jgi:transcriptional regulator with XRE-family HTH domain
VDYFTNTIERIFYFAKSKGISINKLSLEIGVSNSYFNKMFKKKASVGSTIIEKILRKYPDLNAEWLLTGRGDVLKTEGIKGIIEERESNSNSQNISPDNNVPIPIPVNSCPICPEKERTIKALKIALDAKQDEVNALRQHLVDKERLIQLLTKSDERINKQTG